MSIIGNNGWEIALLLYILLPEGMKHQKKVDGMGVEKDFLIDLTTLRLDVCLQDIVKKVLREYRKQKFVICEGLTIYFKNPPKTEDIFLKYEPNENGKYASNSVSEMQGKDYRPLPNPAMNSRYGEFWYSHADLEEARLIELGEHKKLTRENRRKTGDSPCPN